MSVAFVFPGQGSQYPGMGKDIYDAFPVARELFEEASDGAGVDIAKLCFELPQQELMLTYNSQPAILTLSVVIYRVLESLGWQVEPRIVAGHSLGEFSAVCVAGGMSLLEAAMLVRKRGEFMQDAVPAGHGGMMAIIGMSIDGVTRVVESVRGGFVQVANHNSPEQVVVSGDNGGLDELENLLAGAGVRRIVRLEVSAPFHSEFMKPAADKLMEVMENIDFKELKYPLLNNVDVREIKTPQEIKDSFYRQMFSPVRWVDQVRHMVDSGIETFYELGPRNVLRGLIRRIERGVEVYSIGTLEEIQKWSE